MAGYKNMGEGDAPELMTITELAEQIHSVEKTLQRLAAETKEEARNLKIGSTSDEKYMASQKHLSAAKDFYAFVRMMKAFTDLGVEVLSLDRQVESLTRQVESLESLLSALTGSNDTAYTPGGSDKN